MLHFFSAHLPEDVYQNAHVRLAPIAVNTVGRCPWLDEVNKAKLNKLKGSRADWATAARVLQASKMGTVWRGSYQALFVNPGESLDD